MVASAVANLTRLSAIFPVARPIAMVSSPFHGKLDQRLAMAQANGSRRKLD